MVCTYCFLKVERDLRRNTKKYTSWEKIPAGKNYECKNIIDNKECFLRFYEKQFDILFNHTEKTK